MADTLKYYNDNATAFAEGTQKLGFTEIQDKFLSLVCQNFSDEIRLLDLGCGAGRDTKYFLDKGFMVDAVDGSVALCRIASDYTGIDVKCMLFQEWFRQDGLQNTYAGIWACASILHCTRDELLLLMPEIVKALKENGIFYASFKYGDFEGERNGRFFSCYTETTIRELLDIIPECTVEEMWVSGDVREGRGEEKWLNILLRKAV